MVGLIVLAASLAIAEPVLAAGYPWRDHAPPFDFRFGNNFDMRQQSKQLGNGELQGFQFHWLGAIAPGGAGKPFQGFLLKHTARDTFFFLPHNVPVTPGTDEQFQPDIVTSSA